MNRVRSWLTWVGWQRFAFLFVAVPVAAVVGWWLVRLPAPPIESMIPVAPAPAPAPAPATSPTDSPAQWLAPLDTEGLSQETPQRVAVHVVGAVKTPGVYHLPPNARADDALRAAGGPAPNADLRRVNLASAVFDGEQLYIPRVGEQILPVAPRASSNTASPRGISGGDAVNGSQSGDVAGGSGTATTVPLIVDLNRATAADLDRLPGVGPSTAKAIIDHRSRNGPFASVDDLLAVRGIGPAKLAEIRPWVRV